MTSKEMLENAKKMIKKDHIDLKKQKEELDDLENQLKVEKKVLEELKDDKDLSLFQQGVIDGVQSEIEMQKEKISVTESEIKTLAKKIEVLKRDTWMF